jgi:hypothetical protein
LAVAVVFACAGLAALSGSDALAQVSYTGGTYSQNFDGLPTTYANNGKVGDSPDGWIDDTASPGANQFSIPGWYLYFPTSTGEGGANGHQRFRFGNGRNTGAFWGFGSSAADPEKALGSIGATTVSPNGTEMYTALRLTNNTGVAQTSFTVSYDGEQWRDGNASTPETLRFDYALGATLSGMGAWNDPATAFTSVPALNFTSPVFSGTTDSGTAVDGNTAGKVAGITGSVFNINWLPGQDLWLRWADPQLASFDDDGLAIDNVSFVTPATGPPPDINSFQSGPSSSGSTWVGGNPPATGFTYHVLADHNVTVDAPFNGTVLQAEDHGTVTIGPAGNGVAIPNLIIAAGGKLDVTATGDVSIGDPNAPGTLQLNNDVTFDIEPGPASPTCDLCLVNKLSGSGNITINSAPGTSVSIPKGSSLDGTIHFEGSGDAVKVDGNESVNILVMNSSGMNKVVFAGADVSSLTFDKPGIIDHATTTASRLQGGGLHANAQVTIDLTKGYPDNSTQTEERRFQTTGLTGSGNVIVNGTATDFTGTGGAAFPVTLNEFEVGTTGQPTGNVPNSSYTGQITMNDYLNGEIRQNMRRAAFVVNNRARMEVGFQVAHPDPAKNINLGEVTVNSGGTLEVGFEQGPVQFSPFYGTATPGYGTGHHVGQLVVTNAGGRSGDLTLNSGSTLRMQINGLNADQFDSIIATGNIQLGGTLDLLANPLNTDGSTPDAYFPADGDTFTIMSIVTAPVEGDYDGNGSVGQEDYDVWRSTFGTTGNFVAADGNNNGAVDAGDYAIWRKQVGKTASITGAISGDFALNVIDPFTSWNGFTIEKIITPTSVQLKFHSAGSGSSLAASVPEPSSLTLCGLLLGLAAAGGSRRQGKRS